MAATAAATITGTINVLDQARNFSTVSVTDATASTSTTTGALKGSQVDAGIVGDANIGGTARRVAGYDYPRHSRSNWRLDRISIFRQLAHY